MSGFMCESNPNIEHNTSHAKNTQIPTPKTKPKGKVSVCKHGTVFVPKKAPDIIVCPECGCIEIKEHNDSPRRIDKDGYIIDKTMTISGYKCQGCSCEFNIKHTKRSIHRVQGGVGLLLAIVCWIALTISLVWNSLVTHSKDGDMIPFMNAMLNIVKYSLPSIIGLLCIDHKSILEIM